MKYLRLLILASVLFAGCAPDWVDPRVIEEQEETARREREVRRSQTKTLENTPCNDTTYLRLKAMDVNKLTDREYDQLKQFGQDCKAYQDRVNTYNDQQRLIENTHSSYMTWIWICLGIGLIGVAVSVAMMPH